MLRPMFGARSLYLRGKIQLCCTAGQEPWAGVLVCTEKEHHAALLQDFPALVPHPVLGKWLYLSSSHPRFEGIVHDLIRCIKEADARIGVLPQPKKRRSVFSKDNHP